MAVLLNIETCHDSTAVKMSHTRLPEGHSVFSTLCAQSSSKNEKSGRFHHEANQALRNCPSCSRSPSFTSLLTLAKASPVNLPPHLQYQELQSDLHRAAEDNDIGRVEKLESEMEHLASELASAIGLGGRARQKSDIERVRKSVSMAVSRAITAIGGRHKSLGRHLTVSIMSGLTFRYAPEREVKWMV
jgi:hypothetical protein